MDTATLDLFARLGAALLVGALIGFERGWRKRDEPEGSRSAGLRTFALIGFAGGIAGSLGRAEGVSAGAGAIVVAAGFLAVAALAVAIYVMSVRARGRIGATTEFATLVAYGLGVLAGRGEIVAALAGAVVTVTLLDTKAPLHGLLQRIRHDEMRAALKLLLVSAVLLPILPNRGFGPGGVLNPYELWWFVVLVAGLSLAGHFAQRFAGPAAGPVLVGLVGGLVSSTAITVSAARRAAKVPAESAAQATSIAAATAVMCVRIGVIAGVLNPALLPVLGPPLAAGTLAALAFALRFERSRRPHRPADAAAPAGAAPAAPPAAPNDLGAAMIFALVLAGVILAAHYARTELGAFGLYATAALAGLVDVDAVTVSAATIENTSNAIAAGAILVAAAVNSATKVAIASSMGGRALALRVALLFAAVTAAGGIAFAAILFV